MRSGLLSVGQAGRSRSSAMSSGLFVPLQAVIGGTFIGIGSGSFMLLSGKIAGNSGALKAVALGQSSDIALLFFACGLALAGVACARLLPAYTFEMPTTDVSQFIGGIVLGFGTYLGNGCTSGHVRKSTISMTCPLPSPESAC